MNKNINISRISLNEITEHNTKELLEIYSDPSVCTYFDIEPYKVVAEAEEQIKRWTFLKNEKKQIRYGIFYNEKLIGTCGIYSIFWHQNRASLGYDLKKEYWNQGITTEALKMLIIILKNVYKIHRFKPHY